LSRRLLRGLRGLGVLFGLFVLASCGRPSFEEVSQELADLVDPAAKAALNGVDPSERVAGSDFCGDPLTGPENGIQPTLVYRVPISALGDDPKLFVTRAEKVWRQKGLEIEKDETEDVFSGFATKPGYGLEVFVNYTNEEALISGTGPCVDDPEADSG
jgi:hypothetical protein